MEKSDNTDELAILDCAFNEVADKALMMEETLIFPNHWYTYFKSLENPVIALGKAIIRGIEKGYALNGVSPVTNI